MAKISISLTSGVLKKLSLSLSLFLEHSAYKGALVE
jgi:hypothetical protein